MCSGGCVGEERASEGDGGKNKGQTVFEPQCYDVADAYVMARASHADRVKLKAQRYNR